MSSLRIFRQIKFIVIKKYVLEDTEKNLSILVVGDKKINSDKLHINVRGQKEIIEMEKNKFIEKLLNEIKEKK